MTKRPHTFIVLATTWIDRLSYATGLSLRWLSLAMVALTTVIILIRNTADISSQASQELVIYFHASMIMLCLAYGVLTNAHVRVDILYHRFSALTKIWINLLGSICLLTPFALFLLIVSWPFAIQSWEIMETSADPGGLPLVFLLKSTLPLSAILLLLQGLCELLKNLIMVTFIGITFDIQHAELDG